MLCWIEHKIYIELWTASNLTGWTSNSLKPRFIHLNWTLNPIKPPQKDWRLNLFGQKQDEPRPKSGKTELRTILNPGVSIKTKLWTLRKFRTMNPKNGFESTLIHLTYILPQLFACIFSIPEENYSRIPSIYVGRIKFLRHSTLSFLIVYFLSFSVNCFRHQEKSQYTKVEITIWTSVDKKWKAICYTVSTHIKLHSWLNLQYSKI